MKKFKFRIHPLFWIFGAVLIFFGNGYLFLVYVFTAVVHEYAHSAAASFYRCRADEITLYPYGAVLYGEFSGLKPSEEIIVALAGPAFNLFVSVLFTAVWWVFPEIYAYTDAVVMVNISIAVFNMLPVYPLDGGRILTALLKIKCGYRRAFKTVRFMGILCCAAFFCLYVYSLFTQVNYSFAFIALFMLSAVIDGENDGIDSVIYPPGGKFLLRGVEKKTLRVSGEITFLKLSRMLSTQYYYVIEVTGAGGKTVNKFEHADFERLLVKYGASVKLRDLKL